MVIFYLKEDFIMRNRTGFFRVFGNAVIGMAAGVLALVGPGVPVFAEDVVPVIDMGTFENSYEPTDPWIKEGWEYEKKDDFIVLKKYTGSEDVVEVPGKAVISGYEYKVKICNETFSDIYRITEVDFKAVDGQKVTVDGELDKAFSMDAKLKTVDLSGLDVSGVSDFSDIFEVANDTQLTLKGASEDFIDEVAPLLEHQNRYLGTVRVSAKVTLSGKVLSADQFSFKLFEGSVDSGNLVKACKNGADGSIDFGVIKVRDITKPVKLVAVQESVEGYRNKTGNLSVSKSIKLKADGSLAVTNE